MCERIRWALVAVVVIAATGGIATTATAGAGAAGTTESHVDDSDRTLNSGGTYWQGQSVSFADPNGTLESDRLHLRAFDAESDELGALVREVSIDGGVTLDTTDLDGLYVLVVPDRRIRTVVIENGEITGTTAIDDVPVTTTGGTRTIEADAETFQSDAVSVSIPERGRTQSFDLVHDGGTVHGTVTDTRGNPLYNVSVRIEDDGWTHTSADGTYRIDDVPFGTHDVIVNHADYGRQTATVEVTAGTTTERDFDVERATEVRLSIDDVWTDLGQTDETVTVRYSFDEEVEDTVHVAAGGPTSLGDRAVTVGHAPESSYTESFQLPDGSDVEDGDYTVDVSALGQTESASFQVSNAFESGAVEFSQERYQSPAGDFVRVDVTVADDLDEAYLLIGGDREAEETTLQNHLDVLHVTGDTSFVINTRLVGTDAPSEEVYVPVGDGDVTSYAHGIGADAEPEGVFEDVSFRTHRGTEVASTLAEFRDEMGLTSRGSPLQVGRYRLVAGTTGAVMVRDDGIPDLRHAVGRSNLVLTQPQLGEVNTYVLPPGPADRLDRFDAEAEPLALGDIGTLRSDATETDTIARGDRILVEVRASGTFGALLAGEPSHPAVTTETNGDASGSITNQRIATLLDTHEGVAIELAYRSLGSPNNPGSTLQFADTASSDLYVLPDDSNIQWDDADAVGDAPVIGGLYFVVDTRGDDPFDNQPQDGDELEFEMAYESPPGERYRFEEYSLSDGEQPAPFDPAVSTVDRLEHFPYFGDDDATVRTNDSFVFEEPSIEYRQTGLDGDLMVPADENGVIAGRTNIAPGSDVTIQLIASNRPEPTTITVEDVTIDENGEFELTHDFSGLNSGERVEVEFYTPQRLVDNRLLDKRGAIVVDELDEPATFAVSNLPEETTVTRGERLGSIRGTVTNTGEIVDRQMVEFDLDGEPVLERSVTLESGESESVDLAERFVVLPPGTYEYTLQTETDERTGQLTVTAADDETATVVEESDTSTPTVSDPPESTDGDGSGPDSDGNDDAPATILPFGIGTRETFGGTVLVGATYILGHWV